MKGSWGLIGAFNIIHRLRSLYGQLSRCNKEFLVLSYRDYEG